MLEQAQGALHIRGDALGVLHSMLRFKAKDAVLNAIAGELAYLVAPLGLDLRAAHIWSEKNDICDHLSRSTLGQRPSKPELLGATRSKRQPVPRFLLSSLVEKTHHRVDEQEFITSATTTETARQVKVTSGGQVCRN